MDEFYCIPDFAYFLFQLQVTPGASIRLLPEDVDCDDRTFPFPWSPPINGIADYFNYAAILNPVFSSANEFSALTFVNLGGNFTFSLRLGPYWQQVFGGCGAKLKVCVDGGTIEYLSFFPSNQLICCPEADEEPLPPCDCANQVLIPFKITAFNPPPVDFSGYYVVPFFSLDQPCPSDQESIEWLVIPRFIAEKGPAYATTWFAKVFAVATEAETPSFCDFGNGYISFFAPRTDETVQFCDFPFGTCAGYAGPLPDGGYFADNSVVQVQYFIPGPPSDYQNATGRAYCCDDLPPLPPCDCLNQVLLPFKITGFAPLDVNLSGYWLNPYFSIYQQCTGDPISGDIFIPRWVAENGAEYATRWVAEHLKNVNAFEVICDFGNGHIAVGSPRIDETLESCGVPVAKCSGYYVGTLPDATKIVNNDAVVLEYYFPGPSLEYHDTTSAIYCCDEPPPPYPPNYCLPPCGCERACDAVGCFAELAVRLKAGLTGFPAPGATVTVLVQEGHRKMVLTGVYDGTGVKIVLTPQQRKFFVFFRAYSVAVFWNGQIWPMADDARCKYFVAYPGPSQTTLTI